MAPPPLPEGWREAKAADGKSYYYNKYNPTATTTWTRPTFGAPPDMRLTDSLSPPSWVKPENLDKVLRQQYDQSGEEVFGHGWEEVPLGDMFPGEMRRIMAKSPRGATAMFNEKADQDALAALIAEACERDDDDDDDEYAERRSCQCDAIDKSHFQTWLPSLYPRASFCLGTYAQCPDLHTMTRRFDLVEAKLVGKGKFADVLRTYDRDLHAYTAIKFVSFKQVTRASLEKQLRREVELLTTVEHANIVKCHGIVPLAFCARLAIVTELCWRDL